MMHSVRRAASLAVILFVPLLCATRVAAAPADWLAISSQLAPAGVAIDFTPHGTQPGLFYDIIPPEQQCSSCHGANPSDTHNESTYRPFSTWAGTMMANATRDPLFFAALDIANHDQPGVGDFCLRCHTPRGWLMGHVVKAGFGGPPNDETKGAAACLLNGSYNVPDDINSDYGGVTCHYCHRLMPTGPNSEDLIEENADAWVDDQPCPTGAEPCRRGPYAYDDGTSPPPHEWEYSSFHTESAICGVCHNVSTPDTDAGPLKTLKLADGTDTGRPFPVERTFSEWQQSDYSGSSGQTCQGCHMPQTEDPDATACSLRINNRTGNMPIHAFVGGNTWIPGIIKGQYGEGLDESGTGRSESLRQTMEWAREMLGTAATVDTTIQNYTPPGADATGSMTLSVKVTNLSGHKLPTGYAEGRRMWLNVEVHDAAGALVYESAAYDARTGVLTRDAQARVYEVLQGIWNANGTGSCDIEDAGGAAMFHFVRNDCIALDNRIPPLGFEPATTDDPNGYDLRPVGATYPETSPGSGILVNYDTVPYDVTIPAGAVGPFTATARLYYQTASKDYVEFLRNQAVDNGFESENQMCEGGPNRPFSVGPQDKTRGEYLYDLWNQSRIFGGDFDSPEAEPVYGRSPPELMQTGSATTS